MTRARILNDGSSSSRWTRRTAAQVDEAVQTYLASGKPPVESMFDHLFADMPQSLADQREIAIAEAKNHG